MWANSNPCLTGVNMPILNGKNVVDLEVDGVVSGDYPDFSDAYFSNGCYEDGTPLTEDELNQLTDLAGDVLWEMAFESLH
jgi:subtilisin family serine protease